METTQWRKLENRESRSEKRGSANRASQDKSLREGKAPTPSHVKNRENHGKSDKTNRWVPRSKTGGILEAFRVVSNFGRGPSDAIH